MVSSNNVALVTYSVLVGATKRSHNRQHSSLEDHYSQAISNAKTTFHVMNNTESVKYLRKIENNCQKISSIGILPLKLTILNAER